MSSLRSAAVIPSLRNRLRAFHLLKLVLALALALALAALVAVLADALLVLPDHLRARTPLIIAVVLLAILAWGVYSYRKLSEIVVARDLETRSPDLGTVLTNAVQLSQTSLDHPAGELLRRQAVDYGRDASRSVRAWPAARRSLFAFLLAAAFSLLLWIAGLFLLPGLFNSVLPRFLDPYGDHPPYSRLHISVDPLDVEVLYGGQCEVHAVTAGRSVEKLFLVAENAKGATDTVMFLRPDQSHSQTLTNLREDTRFWVTDGRARSFRHTIRVRYTPVISFLEVKTTFPAYTALRPQTRKLKDSALEVPLRSVLSFRAGSNRPLASGTLELTPVLGGDKKTIALVPEPGDAQVVSGEFTVSDNVVFSLTLADTAGLVSSDTARGRVTILPDMRPRIIVLEPGRHAVATPDVSIPISVRAEDDYAVDRVLWFRGLNRSIERPVRMTSLPTASAGVVEAHGQFSLKDLGVRPGDHIEYFFEAQDNYPDGPNVASSRLFSLDIISLEEYKRLLQQMAAQRALFEQYNSLDNHLRRTLERAQTLRDKLNALGDRKPTDDELKETQKLAEEVRRALDEYRKGLDEAGNTSPLFDIEKFFKKDLSGQHPAVDALRNQLGAMMKEAGSNAPLNREEMEKFLQNLSALQRDMNDNVGEPVRLITSVVRLLAHADEFTQLALRQKDLAGLAKRFEDQKGALTRVQQMELQELAASQRQVREGLQRFTETIPELLAKVPDEEEFADLKDSARNFLEKIKTAEIQPDLDKASEKFAALDGPAAYTPAQNAAYKMMALVENLDSADMMGKGQACLNFQPSIGGKLGKTLMQVMGAMRGSGGSGYGLWGDDVGLYGPDVQLAGHQGEGLGDDQGGSALPKHEAASSSAPEPDLARPKEAQVTLERNVKFPLRYRNLVGEYFRIIAETLGQ